MAYDLDAPEPDAGPRSAPWTLGDLAKGIAIVFTVFVVSGSIAGVIAVEMAGGVDEIEDDPDALAVQLAASIPLQIAMVSAAFWFVRKYNLSWSNLGFRKPERGGWWLGPALYGASIGLVIVYTVVLDIFIDLPDANLPDATFDEALPIVLAGVLAVGMAPIGEEVFFRGFVFGGLNQRSQFWLAAIASGLLWGLAHLLNPAGYVTFPAIAGIGVIFAFGYTYSGSLYAPMVAHFLFNLQSFVVQAASA